MIVEEKEAYFYNCARSHSELCSGSRCMAWRWALENYLKTDDAPDAVVSQYYGSRPSTTHGYCGLAGRP